MKHFLKLFLLCCLLVALGLSFLPIVQQYIPSNILLVFIRIGILAALVQIYLHNIFLNNRFFFGIGAIALAYIIIYFIPQLELLPLSIIGIFSILCLIELSLLFAKNIHLKFERIIPNIASLNAENLIQIELYHRHSRTLKVEIIDELPIALQERNFFIKEALSPFQNHTISYYLKPLERGAHQFGALHIYVNGIFGLMQRRFSNTKQDILKVYPSIIKAKEYEKMAFESKLSNNGLKKIRKIGQNYEFAQIRNYIKGDDYRAINWKATSRKNDLMVNTFEDEKAQQIYCVLDKGRQMHLAYEGMSILDHAINNVLVISNIILRKKDKAGILTFSDKIGITIKANSGQHHLQHILDALYKEQPRQVESNYNLLYLATKQFITRRSLLFLHTNFETLESMMNALPVLRKIARTHLLVVILFKNNAIEAIAEKQAKSTFDIFEHTIAMRFVQEKKQMIFKLQQYGIQAILTNTQQLSNDVVNKYLELKARNMI